MMNDSTTKAQKIAKLKKEYLKIQNLEKSKKLKQEQQERIDRLKGKIADLLMVLIKTHPDKEAKKIAKGSPGLERKRNISSVPPGEPSKAFRKMLGDF